MTAGEWKKEIIAELEEAGLYRKIYDQTITALAEILETRDQTKAEFMETGGKINIVHTSDRGAKNIKANPLIKTWMDLNKQALDYWQALGMTAKALKQVGIPKQQGPTLEEMLEELGI